MARGINKVILVGNLGADPDMRFMPNGKAVANLRLATSETWKDRQTGEPRERTEWHSVVLYDKLAEIATQYLHKGSKVYVEGSLRTRKWQDKDNRDRYTTEIVARTMQMVGGRGGTGRNGESTSTGWQLSRSAPRGPARHPSPMDDIGSGGYPDAEEFDDEIPF